MYTGQHFVKYSLFSKLVYSSVSLLHCLYVRMGNCFLCLKGCGSCNQLQNNRLNYKFSSDLHNLSLTRDTVSRGLLRRNAHDV